MFRFPEQRLSVRKSAFLGRASMILRFNLIKKPERPMEHDQVQGGSGEFGW